MSQSLQSMQRAFLDSLRKQDDREIESELMEKIVSKSGMRTYIHAYSSRLVEALNNDHSALGTYLGDKLWHEMCIGYIENYPSRYRSLRNFGDLLPEYLLYADAFKKHPEIAELANLERQLLNCFDAADAKNMEFSDLLTLPEQQWPLLQLSFHPSLQLLINQYNVMAVWQAIKEKKTPPPILKKKNEWILWRDSDRITSFRSVDNSERIALKHFLDGGNFSQFCERLLVIHSIDDVPVVALGFIKSWCHQGWVISVAP